MVRPSPAAQANLERILDEERRGNARKVVGIRVGLTALGALTFAVFDPARELTAVARQGTYAYFVVALLIAALVKFAPKTLVLSTYAVPLIDVPMVSLSQHGQLASLEAIGEVFMMAPVNVALIGGLIVLSAFSLSRTIIVLTSVTALLSMMLMLYRIGFSVLPMALVAIEPVGLAVAATVLVERVRGLIHQSRQRDLLGKYILGKRIGSGGMAEVFLATYSPEGGFERRVAVKKILPSWAEDATSLALFRREAELGAMLNHPNLVHVLDFGFDGETYFIAMEYIDGCSLAQLLRAAVEAQQPLTLKEVTYIAWCLAEALHAIHEHPTPTGTPMHLVHRDVNPPNVMVSRAGEVKLADFGIAREVSGPSLTAVGVMRGKLSYSAPEQVLGQPFDCRADLFALGLSLHELLVGQRLFAGHTDLDIVKAAIHLSVLPPSATRPEVPAALDAIVMGLLERETSRRTPTAHALLQQLSQLNGDLLDVREGRALVAARALTTKATSIATMSSGDTHLGSGAGSGDLATQPGITPSGGSNLATATRATKL